MKLCGVTHTIFPLRKGGAIGLVALCPNFVVYESSVKVGLTPALVFAWLCRVWSKTRFLNDIFLCLE